MLRIKELRERRNLNQEGLAQKISVSQSTISAYEVGERTPDLSTLISLAQFFDVSVDYLIGLSNVKQRIVNSDLPPNELDFLLSFRRLRGSEQEKVQAYIAGLLDNR